MKPGWMRVLAAVLLAGMTLSCGLAEAVRPVVRSIGKATPTASVVFATNPTSAVRYLTTKELREASQDPVYTISIVYPYLQGSDGFNRVVKTAIDAQYDAFKSSLDDAPIVEDDPLSPDFNTLSMDYRIYYSSEDLISVHFTESMYRAGAAHPGALSVVINYSFKLDREVSLDELFVPDSAYLTAISDYCIEHLKNDQTFQFEDGAQPSVENYRNWNLLPEGIMITFDPYQVAAYAAGFIRIIVPYTVLRPYLVDGGLIQPGG